MEQLREAAAAIVASQLPAREEDGAVLTGRSSAVSQRSEMAEDTADWKRGGGERRRKSYSKARQEEVENAKFSPLYWELLLCIMVMSDSNSLKD